jgi:exo-beta-1,3-glucanase (GH17 family)
LATVLERDDVSYIRQKVALEDSLSTYGTENVLGITVGDNYVYTATKQYNDTIPEATSRVVSKMIDVRNDLTALGHDLLVGTSESGPWVTQMMVNGSDL